MAERPGTGGASEASLLVAEPEMLLPMPSEGEGRGRTLTSLFVVKYGAVLARAGPIPRLRQRELARLLARSLQTEADRGITFLLIPVLLAAGALCYFAIPSEPGFLVLCASVLLLGGLAFLGANRMIPRLLFSAALVFMLGMLAGKVETWRMGTRILGAEISTQLTGRVISVEHRADGRVRLTVDVLSTARPELRYAPERVRISARSVPGGVSAGSTISGLVRLMPPSGPVRPGSYDFAFENYFDGIGAVGFFLRGPVLAEQAVAEGSSLSDWLENMRTRIAARIRTAIGGAEGEIAAALIVGVRAGIPEEVNEALRRTGLAHVLSISGLHMALVAATIMGMLRAGFACFPDFASRHPVKKYAAAVALVAAAGYLLVSGAQVAAQRSFIMLAVMLVALLFDRAALTMRNLAIAAIVVLLLSPHEVIGPSFQMSFAATAALIGAYAAWSSRRTRREAQPAADRPVASVLARKLLMAAVALAVTSLVAGLATSVYGAYHFHRVSPLSLGANLAAMPIVSLLVMPSAVLAAFAMPFGMDGPFLFAMGEGLAAMVAIARWFSERSPIDAVGIVPVASVAFFTVALVIATTCTTMLRAAALPFLLVAVILQFERPMPDLLISEDGRLMAIPLGESSLAVNRRRPNGFTIENWHDALTTQKTTPPRDGVADPDRQLGGSGNASSRSTPFRCDRGLCVATHRSGAVVAHAADEDAARRGCAIAQLIVIDDATAANPCRASPVRVLTKKDLARSGSAEVYFGPSADLDPRVRFAVSEPVRPWHVHRQFSREARGLPPYQRQSRQRAEASKNPS